MPLFSGSLSPISAHFSSASPRDEKEDEIACNSGSMISFPAVLSCRNLCQTLGLLLQAGPLFPGNKSKNLILFIFFLPSHFLLPLLRIPDSMFFPFLLHIRHQEAATAPSFLSPSPCLTAKNFQPVNFDQVLDLVSLAIEFSKWTGIEQKDRTMETRAACDPQQCDV